MENANFLWQQVKEKLKESIDEQAFNSTFANINEVYKIYNGYIYIPTANQVSKYRIDKFYLADMDKILSTLIDQKMMFKVITLDDIQKEKEKIQVQPFVKADNAEKFKSRTLRPEYTFENFVTGEANREAFTFSLKVANSPHVTVNPLYIFGDVGLGKTHLMTAIGHFILDNNINANIVYTTAQQFTEDYFMATNQSKDTEALSQFYNFYRAADVLLVDDIQLLKNKIKTQEEFFKLFEYLHENNKQIVITSDRPASELEIMDRLKSRFEWGIPVDVRKPNFSLRKNIIKNKLNFLISDPQAVPDDVLDFIANNFDENVRELEGAVRRFVSYCVAFNYPFTLENAQTSLQSIISKDKQVNDESNSVAVEKVKTIVSSYFNISPRDLSGSSRKQEIAYARMVTAYLLRSVLNLPLKRIGDCLGGRDHATIAHAIDKISNSLSTDQMIKQDVDVLTEKITK